MNPQKKKIETPLKSTGVMSAHDPPKVKSETSNEIFREEFLNNIFFVYLEIGMSWCLYRGLRMITVAEL